MCEGKENGVDDASATSLFGVYLLFISWHSVVCHEFEIIFVWSMTCHSLLLPILYSSVSCSHHTKTAIDLFSRDYYSSTFVFSSSLTADKRSHKMNSSVTKTRHHITYFGPFSYNFFRVLSFTLTSTI